MKKIFISIVIVLVSVFVLGMIFVAKTQQNYRDPSYQAYKDKWFECVDTGSTLTPDREIYKAYKANQPISCN